jgi:acetyl esterase
MTDTRPDVNAYLAALRTQTGPTLTDMDVSAAREMLRQAAPLVERPAREMPRQDVMIPCPGAPDIPARIYRPNRASEAAPVLVFYHGGGWVLGDVAGYDPLCSEIAFQAGMTVVSVDYRLAPEHRFPAAVDDCLAAARWAAAGPDAIGHPISGLVLAGDSAGAELAAVAARELRSALPAPVLAQWLIYPVTDLGTRYPSDEELSEQFRLTEAGVNRFYAHYLGEDDLEAMKRHPHVSPLRAEDWRGLPPAVIFTCALDPLRDQGRAYAAKLATHGVRTVFLEAYQVHGSFTMRKMLPSAQADLLQAIGALELLLKRAPTDA